MFGKLYFILSEIVYAMNYVVPTGIKITNELMLYTMEVISKCRSPPHQSALELTVILFAFTQSISLHELK